MINISDLSLSYKEKIIFKNINLNIPDNKLTVVIGANGTGKTTLFKLITDNLKPDCGKITYNFKKIYYLPQNIKYPSGLSLYEYITSSFFVNSFKWLISQEEKEQTEKILELLEIQDKKNILTENLSSGELQKANIATALLSDADCLLLDEPTSNMDLINQIKTLEILKKLKNNNITCVLIMHDLNAAAMYGDYFVGINRNFNVICENKNNFFTEKNLSEIFGISFDISQNNDKISISVNNIHK